MNHLTPEDFDKHLQRHSQSMADLNKEMTAALASGNPTAVNAVVSKFASTMRVQERLNRLSSRITDAASQSVNIPETRPTIPSPAFEVALPKPQMVQQTISTPHPIFRNPPRGRGTRPKYTRISNKALKGMYLEASHYVVPLWSAIARLNRPFKLSELRQMIRQEIAFRQYDLELVTPKKGDGSQKATPRWVHMANSAFSHSVSTNRRAIRAGKVSVFTRYIDPTGKVGREVVYELNAAGRAEMQRVLSQRNIPTTAISA